jgi:glycosyltransferase involved in cell wall biosynthesis
MFEENSFSVIVCCYNSANRLPKTLSYLVNQDFLLPWEIILINNNSSDDTAKVGQAEWKKCINPNVTFKMIDEEKPGLNYARKKGIEAAKYEYIIFCDDDNWLVYNYLSVAYDILRNNFWVGAIGGECIAVIDEPSHRSAWFETYKSNYAIGKQSTVNGDITSRGYLWGAGLVTTKTIYNKCIRNDFPFFLTDRTGKSLASGGDSELCKRIILKGYYLFYDDRLILYHYIPENRLKINYLNELLKGIDAAGEELSKYDKLIKIKEATKIEKIQQSFKYLIKVAISFFIKNRYLKDDKQYLYLYTGINLGVDRNLKALKKFAN